LNCFTGLIFERKIIQNSSTGLMNKDLFANLNKVE